jgi:general secretion pathway protein G
MSMKRNLTKYLFIFIFVAALTAATLLVLPDPEGNHPPKMRVFADFNAIGSVLKTYKINAGHCPDNNDGLKALEERPASEAPPKRWVQIMKRPPLDPWGSEYQYRSLGEDDPREFELLSPGKDKRPGTKDDLSSLAE